MSYLLKKHKHLSYERVLSGSGLFLIYQFMKEHKQWDEAPGLTVGLEKEDPAAMISELTLKKRSELCVQTLDLFVSILGAEAGNLALKTLATGGIYLGGVIVPKILNKLKDGTFMKAFLNKGRYVTLLKKIPVYVILDSQTALYGAAHYAGASPL